MNRKFIKKLTQLHYKVCHTDEAYDDDLIDFMHCAFKTFEKEIRLEYDRS